MDLKFLQKDITMSFENREYPSPCSYRIKMDENGAQESHMDFYAQFDSIKA